MKKVLVLCLAAAVLATAIISGSVAYFTDAVMSNDNIIRSGNLDIVQYELERGTVKNAENADTPALVAFQQEKNFLPGVINASMAEEEQKVSVNLPVIIEDETILPSYSFTMQNAHIQNYVDKIVCAKNEGTLPTYIRTFVAIPANYSSGTAIQWIHPEFNAAGNWTLNKSDGTTANIIPNQDIDGIVYDIYVATRKVPLQPGVYSEPSLLGFYMDSKVSNENGYYVYLGDGSKTQLWPTAQGNIKILVKTESAQANYFDEISTDTETTTFLALETTFEKTENGSTISDYHPWLPKETTTTP